MTEQVVNIVDDDDAVREALMLLMHSEDIPARAFASAEEFLDNVEQINAGCLLLDVRMPGMNGLQLLDTIKKMGLKTAVIFLTGHGDVTMAVKAMKAGALDFIEKPFDNNILLRSVRKCLSQSVSINCVEDLQRQMSSKIALLTKRERQVMELLVDGKQNKMIARELDISTRTVELHRAKIMEKLHAHSLSDIVRTALQSAEYS